MTGTFVIETAALSELVPDKKNPRLTGYPETERDTYIQMAKAIEGKLVTLASDIVTRGGLNPATVFITIRGDRNSLIVLDGNRRLTALRALEQPSLVESALDPSSFKKLKGLHDDYSSGARSGLPIEEVLCAVFESRPEANKWIELIHEGERDGAGPVPWSAQQKARHRDNNSETKAYHMQVLDFVMRDGEVGDVARQRYDEGKYPVSTLQRTISTPEVRHMLGIDADSGEVKTHYPKDEVLKGLTRLVDEIGSGKTKVGKVMDKGKRIKYIESFGPHNLPDPTTKGEIAYELDEVPEPDPAPSDPTPKRSKDNKHSSKRKHLIPSAFTVEIDVPRINDIYLELKRRLELSSHPNAIGVLLRVFLELSVDEYIERNNVSVAVNKDLAPKVKGVADYMVKKRVMKANSLKSVRQAVTKAQDGSGTIITTLNTFVHNREGQPTARDLTAMWDRLSTFIEKLWS